MADSQSMFGKQVFKGHFASLVLCVSFILTMETVQTFVCYAMMMVVLYLQYVVSQDADNHNSGDNGGWDW